MSEINLLRERFTAFLGQRIALRELEQGDGFAVFGAEPNCTIEFQYQQEESKLEGERFHAHFRNPNQAIRVLAALLLGNAMSISVTKNGVPAYGLLAPVQDDKLIEEWGTETYYLNPMDPLEWAFRTEDHWVQEVVTFSVEQGNVCFETTSRPLVYDEVRKPATLCWLTDRLGEPPPGFRWLADRHMQFAFPVIREWKATSSSESQHSVDYQSPDESLFFRAVAVFRGGTLAHDQGCSECPPHKIEEEIVPDFAPGWMQIKWTLLFLGEAQDMMGILELLWPDSSEGPTESMLSGLRSAIQRSMRLM